MCQYVRKMLKVKFRSHYTQLQYFNYSPMEGSWDTCCSFNVSKGPLHRQNKLPERDRKVVNNDP